jgi:hypothetical protein
MADPFIEAESIADRAEFFDRYRFKLYGIVFKATTLKFLLKDEGKSYEDDRERLLKECDKWLSAIYDDISKPKG